MKTLLILRHAKSSWKDTHLIDHQRPLNKRGKKAAPEMARRLLKRGVRPDVIVSSDARRAMETAVSMAEILGVSPKAIRQNPDLYHGAPDRILDVVHRFNDQWKQVMVVGHNPGLEAFLQIANGKVESLPTASIAYLTAPVDNWNKLDKGENIKLKKLWRPKDLD